MKHLFSSKLQILLVFLVLFAIPILTNSCKKDRFEKEIIDVEQKFFKLPTNANPILVRVIEHLKQKNNEHQFVNDFVKRHGYPSWEFAKFKFPNDPLLKGNSQLNHLEGGDTLIVIPTLLPYEEFVKSLLNVKLNGDILYKIFEGEKYADFGFSKDSMRTEPNADDIANAFMKFESEIFQITYFTIKDNRLFDYWPPGTTKPDVFYMKSAVPMGPSCIQCELHYVGELPPSQWNGFPPSMVFLLCDPSTGSSGCEWEGPGAPISIYIATNMPNTSGGTGTIGWTPTPGGGTTGSTTTSTTNMCARGWLRYIPGLNCPGEPQTGFNPYQADTIIITDDIRDSFPCVQQIIDTIAMLRNLNAQTQLALFTVFGVQTRIHLTIGVDWTLTRASMNGYLDSTSVDIVPAPGNVRDLDFTATIKLNPWVLNNSTKEFIANVIIHESFHAYISFKMHQAVLHTNGVTLDSIRSIFPIYIGVYGTGTLLPNELNEHNIMAANLIEQFTNALHMFDQNGDSYSYKDSIYKALAWEGLRETTVWRNKSDTCHLGAISVAARDTSYGAGHSNPFFGHIGCPAINTFSYDSLKLKMPCH